MKNTFSYEGFTHFFEDLVKNKKTSGPNQSDELAHYTKLNYSRMKRWLKTLKISNAAEEKIKNIKEKQKWILLTEAWCGDAAHSTSIIHKLAALNPNIEFKIMLRDENLELMDQYLTNGGRSIPKLIAFDADNKEIFNWGPRPKDIQKSYIKMRASNVEMTEIKEDLQKQYNAAKGLTIVNEITDQI